MKVAVVGSGVSGLAATWLLNEYSDHEVHLYEADTRPGGHANTVKFKSKGDLDATDEVDVDTGFIVFNPPTYPNFLRFLQMYSPSEDGDIRDRVWPFSWLAPPPHPAEAPREGILISPTEMTFSVSRDGGNFEWAGKNLLTVFCQPWRLLDSVMWRMIYDIFRFNTCARRFLARPHDHRVSIGTYLRNEGYSDAFKDNYLIPMTAAIWSTPPDRCFDDFPAHTLIQFMYNHNLLQIIGKPNWLTICGGSRRYVNQVLRRLPPSQFHLASQVTGVYSIPNHGINKPQVELTTNDEKHIYDHVILACHSDEARRILQAGNITPEEESILSSFQWNKNEVLLHSDPQLMPRSRMAWSCWNYLTFADGNHKANPDRISLTYGMNNLQHIPENRFGPVLATLNPPPQIVVDESKVQGRWKYDHPVLNEKALKAQQQMHRIQNKRSISFAGAYLKYGFHEDGFTSGLLAACSIEDIGLYERLRDHGVKLSPEVSSKVIGINTVSIRPPFPIEHADHHLYLRETASDFFFVKLFDVLESSGFRASVGACGTMIFGLLRYLMSLHYSVLVFLGTLKSKHDAKLK